jgi:hypothetical protein
MAFEQLEPFGWPILRAILDWCRSALALIVSASAGSQIDEEQMPRIQVGSEHDPPEEPETPLDEWPDPDAEFSATAGEPTSEDILRDLREQNMFRM